MRLSKGMLPRPRPLSLPPQRPSPSALLAVGALHAALLWLISQQWPVAQAVRQVVYQYVQPLRTPTADAAPSSRAITRPALPALNLRATTDLPVFANTPETSVPLKTTRQLPDVSQAPSQTPGTRKPAETPPPEPVPVPVPVPVEAPIPPVPVPPAPAVTPEPAPQPPVPAPAPVPAPVPTPVAAPVPAPVPLPASVPLPAPAPAPASVAAPVPVPEPQPVAVPVPAPVPAPAPPAPTPVPVAQPIERLQAPVVELPVPAGSPAAASAVVVPVPAPPRAGPPATAPGNASPAVAAPAPAGPPGGAAAGSPAGVTGGAAAGGPGGGPGGVPAGVQGGVPGGAPGAGPGGIAAQRGAEPRPLLLPNLPLLPGPYRVQPRRSLADMANEQLRRGKPRDPLAESMQDAALEDCVRAPTNTPTVGGLLAAPGLVARALSGRCPK